MCKDNDYILHSYAIWQLFSPFGKSPRTAAGSVRSFRQLDCRLSPILCRAYQMCARLFAGIKSLSPFLILNASYHASISGRAAFTRAMLGECGSTVMRYSKYSGLALPAHTRAHERKKRCSGVKPSKVFNGFFFMLF